jgi:hypothetical protein
MPSIAAPKGLDEGLSNAPAPPNELMIVPPPPPSTVNTQGKQTSNPLEDLGRMVALTELRRVVSELDEAAAKKDISLVRRRDVLALIDARIEAIHINVG